MAQRVYSSEEIDLALAAFALEGGHQKRTMKLLKASGAKVTYKVVHDWANRTYVDRYVQISVEVREQVGTKLADTFHRLADTSTELAEDALARLRALLDRKDGELAECEKQLNATEAALQSITGEIAVEQREIAIRLEIPDADALIEEILSDKKPPEELDKVLIASLNAKYKRRASIVADVERLWRRRESLEVTFKELTGILHEAAVVSGISTEKLALLNGQPTERVEHSFPELKRALEAKGVRLAVGKVGGAAKLPVVDVPSLPAGDG